MLSGFFFSFLERTVLSYYVLFHTSFFLFILYHLMMFWVKFIPLLLFFGLLLILFYYLYCQHFKIFFVEIFVILNLLSFFFFFFFLGKQRSSIELRPRGHRTKPGPIHPLASSSREVKMSTSGLWKTIKSRDWLAPKPANLSAH